MKELSPHVTQQGAIYFFGNTAKSLRNWLAQSPKEQWPVLLRQELHRLFAQTMKEILAEYGITEPREIDRLIASCFFGVVGQTIQLLQQQRGTDSVQGVLDTFSTDESLRLLLIGSLADMMMTHSYSLLEHTPGVAQGIAQDAGTFFRATYHGHQKTLADIAKDAANP